MDLREQMNKLSISIHRRHLPLGTYSYHNPCPNRIVEHGQPPSNLETNVRVYSTVNSWSTKTKSSVQPQRHMSGMHRNRMIDKNTISMTFWRHVYKKKTVIKAQNILIHNFNVINELQSIET